MTRFKTKTMKITSIDYNDYGRKFISIEVEPNEFCKTEPYSSHTNYSFFPVDPEGKTHAIEVNRHHFSTGLTGQTIGYGDTWAIGYGSGAAMGWTVGHSLEYALNVAKAFCKVIEENTLVASIDFDNVESDYEAHSKDQPRDLTTIILEASGIIGYPMRAQNSIPLSTYGPNPCRSRFSLC